jgi:hypothetical protein
MDGTSTAPHHGSTRPNRPLRRVDPRKPLVRQPVRLSSVLEAERALEQARLAPLNNVQHAIHAASANLAPRIHGVSVGDHIASLLGGNYQPTTQEPSNSIDALQDIRNVLSKLL